MNLVYCHRCKTKLTSAACEKYQTIRPEVCRGCPGPVECDLIDLVGVTAPALSVSSKPKKEAAVAKRKCAKCNEVKTIVCRGLCYSCRKSEIDAGTLDQNYPPKHKLFTPKAETPEENNSIAGPTPVHQKPTVEAEVTPAPAVKNKDRDVVVLTFLGGDRELYDNLSYLADKNRRDIDQEILLRLEQSVGGEGVLYEWPNGEGQHGVI